ncbi:PepSY-associated TM helix domain-containing protein [Bradyrhizobium sp.]|jgi:uncharacterized iron-regulated membrane protein|uniref:PepSY-associated TM helix domain-containing protein n=1 Tax=Bradyrhizobium sp. TaxID=376 RepID=UPI002E03036A|nr:PepSY-associated TM helix domain-containing protein [Bradyrhizobium sp.]
MSVSEPTQPGTVLGPPPPAPRIASRTEQQASTLRLARSLRWVHKWVGALLALIMVTLSVTGIFVAFKNEVEYLQPAGRSGSAGNIAAAIPPARVAEIILALQLPEAPTLKQINRIELRPSKRMYKVRLEPASAWSSPREIQVDAMTGGILNDGVRGDQLWMDLHSLAVFGVTAKIVTMTISGLALLWLGLSGLYLFFYPRWFRARLRRHARE